LLAEAGYGPDNPLKFQLRYNTSEQHKKVAIAIAAMWKELGVQPELFNSEVKVHYNDLQEGNFEVARAGWVADYNDPQNFLFLMKGDTGPLNYARYENPEFDRLMDQSDRETDPEKRLKLLREAELIGMQDLPVIPIYYLVSKNLVSLKIAGYQDNVADVHPVRFLSLAE
jgi:oligopeptide transport system substrate-binding protein